MANGNSITNWVRAPDGDINFARTHLCFYSASFIWVAACSRIYARVQTGNARVSPNKTVKFVMVSLFSFVDEKLWTWFGLPLHSVDLYRASGTRFEFGEHFNVFEGTRGTHTICHKNEFSIFPHRFALFSFINLQAGKSVPSLVRINCCNFISKKKKISAQRAQCRQ